MDQQPKISVANELLAIRNTMQLTQQSVSRLEKHLATVAKNKNQENLPKKRSASSTPTIVTKRRQLLENIANRDPPPRPCWKHRVYGAAARECDPPCNYQRPIPIKPAKLKQAVQTKTETEKLVETIAETNLSDATSSDADSQDTTDWAATATHRSN